MRFNFGSHTLDLSTFELHTDGEPVVLEPRTFDVLTHLVRHRDRVVTKEELLDEVWGDRFVSESALTSQIKHLRGAVGDDGRSQTVIRTHHRIGYRFVADVTVEQGPGARGPSPPPRWAAAAAPLVGRDADLDSIADRLAHHRLVTVTGTGGVGKTALARQIVTAWAPARFDESWVCHLDNTRDPGSVGNVVLAAIGEGQQSDADPVESVARALERRRALLVLDNCEHVLDAAAALARTTLERCPDLQIVATSRAPLRVEGESLHALEPLHLDDAVSCFVSKAIDYGARVLPDDPALRQLCQRLDGVPLALELAAARARVVSPSEMLGLLEDRFRLLRGDGADDDRHHSLWRTIAWSWNDLDPDDQALLAELSVFVGTFTLEDARAVALPEADDPLDAVDSLGRLVDRSLLTTAASPGGRTRFRLLESVRDFAAEQLEHEHEARARHASHFAALAESLDEQFQTASVDEAIAAMHAAWDNLRAAVGYAAEADDRSCVGRTVRAVGAYADVFQIYEVLDWCAQADLGPAVADVVASEVVADVMAVEARMLAHRGHQEEARRLADRAHGQCETYATVLSVLWCAYYGGDLDLVVRLADRLLELSRSDRGFDRGFAEGFAAIVAAVRQERAATTTTVTPSDAEEGVLGVQDCLTAGLELCAADTERAAELLQAVVDQAVRHDYRLHLGAAASTLTQITLPGRPDREAMKILRHTLRRYLDHSMWVLISADTVMAAKLLAGHGDVETACRLLGARLASGYAVGLSEMLRAMLHDELEGRLGTARFAELARQGAGWRPPEAAAAAIDALDRALGDEPGSS